ncbi:hypothetical protein DPMN_008453 [Dreissena polymorpha]|uniref:Uncharacterized protein n=1 Tax=Dreissena polymorpha TaxID=45954 RepID=A0A9D4RZ96_DREPO|nr:hypothetical protein DPMN_008453 [Dreissena polymorpha]
MLKLAQTDRPTDQQTEQKQYVPHYYKCLRNVNARVFTNQMWTDGQRTKTNPKTSPEQSAIFQHTKNVTSIVKTQPHPPGSHFHDDWTNNVTSRVHVIQLTVTIFQLNSRITKTNVLTKFHENRAKNVTSRRKMPQLVRHINKTNVLINFHDDWAKIVTSRVFTRKTAPPTGGHLHEDWAFNVTSTVFKLDRVFIGTNLLTKFHEDRIINVASRVFTNKKCGRTDDGQRPVTKAHLTNQETKVLTKFHENWAKNVTSRVFICFHCIHIEKNAPPTGGYLLTKFHEDRTINVA